jgi:sugar-phosphatase
VPSAVLFDVDGVLIDSAAMHRDTWGAWADLHTIDRAAMFEGIHGERGLDTIMRVAPHLDGAAELKRLNELLIAHEEKATPYPEASALLRRYAGRCGLVTSGPKPETLARFLRLGLPVPDVVVCGEDVSAGKPDPEPYALGAGLLGLPATDCVVVEDAPAGIVSGRAAGCYVLAVTTSLPAAECVGAHEVLEDLGAVAARLARLVPAD